MPGRAAALGNAPQNGGSPYIRTPSALGRGKIKKKFFLAQHYDFIDYRDEDGTSELINLLDQTDAMVTYYDLKAKDFVTKSMYVSGDKIEASLIDDEFYANPFQLRFTANKVE